METLEVDGSFGEGGGQILRTAVAFSVIQGRAIHVTKIRGGREVPGLRQQHVSTLKALAETFSAELSGADVGSSEIQFVPGRPSATVLSVDMKTAASIPLLLQAVVPAVSLTGSAITLELIGGTDVPWSPTFDYMATVAAAGYARLGIPFKMSAARRGYYPRGGGRVTAEVGPASLPPSLDLPPSDEQYAADLVSRCAGLPRHVAERQLESMERVLTAAGLKVGSKQLTEEQADSPGSSVLASVTEGGRVMGADAIGARGRRAEDVGRDAGQRLLSALGTGAPVDANLADMLAPLLSLAEKPSALVVPEVSLHLKTSLHVAKLFTGCDYSWKERGPAFSVEVSPVSGHNA